jgi:indolepyruvate ferredoxin oxidoreductase alpha subunit
MAHGISKVIKPDDKSDALDLRRKVVGVIGDSTFFHSGITSLMGAAYNEGATEHHSR